MKKEKIKLVKMERNTITELLDRLFKGQTYLIFGSERFE